MIHVCLGVAAFPFHAFDSLIYGGVSVSVFVVVVRWYNKSVFTRCHTLRLVTWYISFAFSSCLSRGYFRRDTLQGSQVSSNWSETHAFLSIYTHAHHTLRFSRVYIITQTCTTRFAWFHRLRGCVPRWSQSNNSISKSQLRVSETTNQKESFCIWFWYSAVRQQENFGNRRFAEMKQVRRTKTEWCQWSLLCF